MTTAPTTPSLPASPHGCGTPCSSTQPPSWPTSTSSTNRPPGHLRQPSPRGRTYPVSSPTSSTSTPSAGSSTTNTGHWARPPAPWASTSSTPGLRSSGSTRSPRSWAKSTPPAAWQRRQNAANTLNHDVFDREHLRRGRSLTEIGEATGHGRHLVTRLAKEAGITPPKGKAPFRVDAHWLREQYCDRLRATSDIATELGISQMMINLALRRFGIPARPQGVASFPEMLDALDADTPRDIRAAVEGRLRGWLRLHRFHIAMRSPSIKTAATYLGAPQTALTHQFHRLEDDIGTPLFERSSPARQRPTPRGGALLEVLDGEQIQQLMRAGLRDRTKYARHRTPTTSPEHCPSTPGVRAATPDAAPPGGIQRDRAPAGPHHRTTQNPPGRRARASPSRVLRRRDSRTHRPRSRHALPDAPPPHRGEVAHEQTRERAIVARARPRGTGARTTAHLLHPHRRGHPRGPPRARPSAATRKSQTPGD